MARKQGNENKEYQTIYKLLNTFNYISLRNFPEEIFSKFSSIDFDRGTIVEQGSQTHSIRAHMWPAKSIHAARVTLKILKYKIFNW